MDSARADEMNGPRNKKKTYALILARGGSKGIPHKNIAMLLGKPLIAYTIEAALASQAISAVYVSTDDQSIADVAIAYGADVIWRPEELSQDMTTSGAATLHAIRILSAQKGDISLSDTCESNESPFFVMLQCTSPLRSSTDIDNAVALYVKSRKKCLFSVCEAEHHPYKMLIVDENNSTSLLNRELFEAPRQKLPKAFRCNGAIYIRDIADFLEYPTFFTEPFAYYHMDSTSSVDIDHPIDLDYASLLLQKKLQ